MQVGSMAHVINGGSGNQIRSPILRSAIGIDNNRALSRETLHNAGSDRLDYRPYSFGVVVSGQAHQDVYLAYVDQLAKKIIRENTFLGQLELRTQVVKAVFRDAPSGISRCTLRIQFRFVAVGTSRTGKGPWLKDKAGPPPAGKYSCRTSQSGYFLCSDANRVPQPGPNWKHYSPPGPFRFLVAARDRKSTRLNSSH